MNSIFPSLPFFSSPLSPLHPHQHQLVGVPPFLLLLHFRNGANLNQGHPGPPQLRKNLPVGGPHKKKEKKIITKNSVNENL